MPSVAFDLRQPEAVAHEVGEANQRLARERDVPSSILELISDLSDAIAEADNATISQVDPSLWIQIQAGALRAQSAAALDDDREQRRAVRIAL